MATAKEKLVASAQKLVEKGAFEKAIKEYLRVVQEDAADVRIWLKIGDLYAKIGKKPEATDTYQRVAQFYSDQGFYLKSVAVYKQILKLEPRLVDVNQRLAELYKQLGLISDAINQYEQVAAFFHKEGKVREALTAMKQIVELDPETVAARIKLAEMYSRENMPREAIDEFTRAAEQLKEQQRVDEYMKVAERLLFHAPDNKPVTKELARLYIDKNDARRALPKLQVLFKADPRDLDVLRLLARAFEGLEQRPKAVSVYKELARILVESGDTRGANEVFQQILAIDPNDADAQAAVKGKVSASLDTGTSQRNQVGPAPMSTAAHRAVQGGGPVRTHATGAERALDATGARPAMPAEPSAGQDVVADEIAKILGETDVYIKYNLHAKAIEHLQRVFERQPRHTAAREKLKALYITTGRRDEAILELWALAEHVEAGRARRYVREIFELDPSNARAAQILGEQVRSPGQAAEEPEDDFGVAPPIDFGMSTGSNLVRNEPPTQRGKVLESAEVTPTRDDVLIEEEVEIDEELLDADAEAAGVEIEGLDEESVDEHDDLIPVVVDTGAQRVIAEQAASDSDDRERFSLEDDEPSAPPMVAEGFQRAESDEATRFAGGPRGIAEMPLLHSSEVEVDEPSAVFDGPEETGTGQMSADELSSFDDPAQDPAPVASAAEEVRAHETEQMSLVDYAEASGEVDVEASPAAQPDTGSGRRPAPAPIPDPLRSETSLEDDLDESDFFMQQSLFEEARSMLSSLLERYPNHPLVLAKLRDLDALDPGAAPEPPPLEPLATGNAMSAALPTELPGSGEVSDVIAQAPSGEPVEVTRRGVIERGVSAEDFETHYDLGIAYKEMGLIDDAMAEFRIVMKDPTREVQCQLMIGLCHLEKQAFTEAINQFKKGLYVEGITDAEALSLYYELGQAYEKVGDPREALYYYDKVQKRDPKFRDLARRMRALRGEEPEPAPPARSDDLDAAFDSLLDEG